MPNGSRMIQMILEYIWTKTASLMNDDECGCYLNCWWNSSIMQHLKEHIYHRWSSSKYLTNITKWHNRAPRWWNNSSTMMHYTELGPGWFWIRSRFTLVHISKTLQHVVFQLEMKLIIMNTMPHWWNSSSEHMQTSFSLHLESSKQ